MKIRIITVLLCLMAICTLSACGEKQDKSDGRSTDATVTTTQPDSDITQQEGNDTTLMIYMVGSDLEAKGGAGTNDMEEILGSSVDISVNNILIYAGGSKVWHNDDLSTKSGHSILKLTDGGYEAIETKAEASMGEALTLAEFLNYAYTNFKTNNYALILWDHGNGPLIGYGKDMLHENDALTLLEMKEALKASPFSADNKLSWVGFDACLMSSVELACIWQDHADYLIASQEIEPTFGWNYAFLQQLGKTDTKSLADNITKQYMDSCLAYYERKNYDHRDTTLACMDLSKLDTLKTSLENLFSVASKDVATEYTSLVSARVNSRSLGRATTGSEYDLVDLMDMVDQMSGAYPNEGAAVKTAIDEFVVHNVTNTTGCCGLSIYYPFYNKKYFEKAWGDVYADLNVLPSYIEYLDKYTQNWLKNDLLQSTASSVMPQTKNENEFVLELTEDQSKAFADAKYYILTHEGEGLYTRIYTSSAVVKSGNKLTAGFDGNILYAKNDLDWYWIPVAEELDTVGDYTRYSAYVNLTNDLPMLGQEKPEGYQHEVLGHRFYISVNNKTKQIYKSALVPYNEKVDTETLVGGKLEDADLSQWSQYYFIHERHRFIQRDEKGTILPLNKWETSSYLSANVSRVGDGLEFVMAPIPKGKYFLMFEIEDVQGNKYCSELLPINSSGGTLPKDFAEQPVNTSWTEGDSVELFTQAGIAVSLTTSSRYDATSYALKVKNSNDFDIVVLGNELFYNDSVDCHDGYFGYFLVKAGETVTDGSFDFGVAQDLGQMKDLRSIEFSMSVVTASGNKTLISQKAIYVDLSEYSAGLRKDPPEDSLFSDANLYKNTETVIGLLAKEQILFDKDGMKCILLGLGGNGEQKRITLTFRFENTSTETQNCVIKGLLFDDIFANVSSGPITVYPNTIVYFKLTVTADDLELYDITTASSVSIVVSHMEFATLQGGGGFSQIEYYPVTLASKGEKASFNTGKALLYEDSSVQIYLKTKQKNAYRGYEWICTLVNKGESDILLDSANITLNGNKEQTDSLYSNVLCPYDTACPAGSATVFKVRYTSDVNGDIQIKFAPQFYDFAGEKLLYNGSEIELNNK